ncbi:VWA domain-containing protein [Hydrogenophaga sp.]|uniref:VWA domain-containing protein n=1 Tax=Hydrogenophaga sp. TaxID=1904254 RepID=UPI002734B143|nr:VWA domain-containing protein [Hydrogenophaga sp.]MDP2986445.1 VWA domain-containing protein [Hydrogenophaga sp.]
MKIKGFPYLYGDGTGYASGKTRGRALWSGGLLFTLMRCAQEEIAMKFKKLVSGILTATALGMGSGANAAIVADIMWVIDTSGSMGDDIAQVKARILDFNTVMVANSIDANYGLVRYGGAPSLIQDFTTFATFSAAGSPFSLLTDNGGGTEDGSLAIQTALTATYRENSVRNIILVTDEDDDVVGNRANLQADLDATVAKDLINIIGNPNDDGGSYYRDLAPANGGAFFNILDFRNNPQAFFTNFINTKVKEIVDDFCTLNPTAPECQNRVPEPGTLALLGISLAGLATLRRRKLKA